VTTIQDYRNVVRDQTRSLNTIAKRGDVAHATEYFKANIGKVSTVDEFMADSKLYRYVMEAFDLGSQVFAKGLIKKVLEGGVTSPDALANRMNDKKFKEMATILAFKESDGATLKEPKIVQAIVDRYTEVKLEEKAEETNPAVRLALYFKRKSSTITNWYQVMADRALQKVVFTTLGLPDQTALQNIDNLVAKLAKRIDIKDFQDLGKLSTFLDKFAAMYDVQNGAQTASSPYAAMTTITGSTRRASIISIDGSVLKTLMGIKRF
jgi:hypothetical protein